MRNLLSIGFDLLYATQVAAVAGSNWIGRGDKNSADLAATNAMRDVLNEMDFNGRIVIGEGEKDEAPGLFKGETLGKRKDVEPLDIAVDPIDGTSQTAKGGPEAMSVIAVGHHNKLFAAPDFYMKKVAIGPHVRKREKYEISLRWSIERLVSEASWLLDKPIHDLTVCLLDRPRHDGFIREFKAMGCRIKLINDCDVSASIATALHDNAVDLYYGIGGAPEGVITAAAMKCLGGYCEGQLVDKDGKAREDKIFTMEELAQGEVLFCATGVTTGYMLDGVRTLRNSKVCNSVLMHYPTMNVHWVETECRL